MSDKIVIISRPHEKDRWLILGHAGTDYATAAEACEAARARGWVPRVATKCCGRGVMNPGSHNPGWARLMGGYVLEELREQWNSNRLGFILVNVIFVLSVIYLLLYGD